VNQTRSDFDFYLSRTILHIFTLRNLDSVDSSLPLFRALFLFLDFLGFWSDTNGEISPDNSKVADLMKKHDETFKFCLIEAREIRVLLKEFSIDEGTYNSIGNRIEMLNIDSESFPNAQAGIESRPTDRVVARASSRILEPQYKL
jgi:hypothetical protein